MGNPPKPLVITLSAVATNCLNCFSAPLPLLTDEGGCAKLKSLASVNEIQFLPTYVATQASLNPLNVMQSPQFVIQSSYLVAQSPQFVTPSYPFVAQSSKCIAQSLWRLVLMRVSLLLSAGQQPVPCGLSGHLPPHLLPHRHLPLHHSAHHGLQRGQG